MQASWTLHTVRLTKWATPNLICKQIQYHSPSSWALSRRSMGNVPILSTFTESKPSLNQLITRKVWSIKSWVAPRSVRPLNQGARAAIVLRRRHDHPHANLQCKLLHLAWLQTLQQKLRILAIHYLNQGAMVSIVLRRRHVRLHPNLQCKVQASAPCLVMTTPTSCASSRSIIGSNMIKSNSHQSLNKDKDALPRYIDLLINWARSNYTREYHLRLLPPLFYCVMQIYLTVSAGQINRKHFF